MSGMAMWTIYDRPSRTYPRRYVARRFINGRPTDQVILADSVRELRSTFGAAGLVRVPREPSDDLAIVESWQ